MKQLSGQQPPQSNDYGTPPLSQLQARQRLRRQAAPATEPSLQKLPLTGEPFLCCLQCQEEQHVIEVGEGKYTMRYLSHCACDRKKQEEQQEDIKRATAYKQEQERKAEWTTLGLDRIAQFQLGNFKRSLLTAGAIHPLDLAERWTKAVLGQETADRLQGPPHALLFYSQGKGRGKTHLAAAIANHIRLAGRRVAFVQESSYLSYYWSLDLGAKDTYQTLIGEHCFLTVIDDLGQTAPRIKDGSSGAAAAWYDLIDRRYSKNRWTIITTNKTLEELLEQGTLTEAAYSRLCQMTRRQVVLFDGPDARLLPSSELV